jgi:hypothetical protein
MPDADLIQVHKLRNAMREYENDRWRIISTKVGNGFSPAACKEKAVELSGDSIENEGSGSHAESATDDTNTFDHHKPLDQTSTEIVNANF